MSKTSMDLSVALEALRAGADEVWVESRAVAEALLRERVELADVTGWPVWKVQTLLRDGFANTYAWEDEPGGVSRLVLFDAAGRAQEVRWPECTA